MSIPRTTRLPRLGLALTLAAALAAAPAGIDAAHASVATGTAAHADASGGAAAEGDFAAGWSAELIDTIDLADAREDAESLSVLPEGTPFGGISGLDHISGDRYLALSDDRATEGPARAYTLTLPRNDAGGTGDAVISDPVLLTNHLGLPYAPGTVDPESIRVLSDGHLLWTSEGKADAGLPPAITLATAEGRAERSFSIPEHHRPRPGHGVRDNLAYEGLTISADGTRATVLAEGPLEQDPDEPGAARTRMTEYDFATGEPVREFAYPLDAPPEGADSRGATEVIAAGEGLFLVLERSYIEGRGNAAALHLVDVRGADDVLGTPALDGTERPVAKRPLLELGPGGGAVDNVESLAWGPVLSDGRRTLLIASDDNFSDNQRSLVHTVAVGMPG